MSLKIIEKSTLLSSYIADTMALIIRLEGRKMPDKSKQLFELAEQGKSELFIPAIVLSEIGYLSERNKIDTDLKKVKHYFDSYKKISELPLDFETINTAFTITDIPELHDRLIAATGKRLGIPIITNDPAIRESKHVKTVWK